MITLNKKNASINEKKNVNACITPSQLIVFIHMSHTIALPALFSSAHYYILSITQ